MQTEDISVSRKGLLQQTRLDMLDESGDDLLEEITTDQHSNEEQQPLTIQLSQKGKTTMSDNTIRALIRYLQPLAKLREDMERAIHMELFDSTGNVAVRTYQGLYSVIRKAVDDDPYLESLSLEVGGDASEREKINLVHMLSGQLLAFVQGYVGIGGFGEGSNTHIQTAPNININNVTGEAGKDLLKAISNVIGDEEDEEE